MNMLDLVGFVLNRKKSELDLTQDIDPVSQNPFTYGLRGSLPSRVQSLGASCLRTPSILLPCTNLCSSDPAYGVTQLGLRSHPSGLLVPETPSTSFSFVRSDRPVYATASIRSSGPCQPSTALAGPTFFLPQESLSAHSMRSSRFLRMPPRRGGALTWVIPRFRVPGPIQTASSTSIIWSSRWYLMPYSIGLKCSRATGL